MQKEKKPALRVGSILAAMLLVIGMTVGSITADAAVADSIVYESGYTLSDYWSAENAQAPVKAGYVFGGWYSAAEAGSYLTADLIDTNDDGTVDYDGALYAKFVPAQVLSIKAQNEANTDAETAVTKLRVITALDCKDYRKIGFEIYLANRSTSLGTLETTKMYTGILESGNVRTASSIFGEVAQYVSVWALTNVAQSNFSKIVYVRPYWVTMDGTRVNGMAKYVHVEDGYLGYTSVPIDLLDASDVAAGKVTVTYSGTEALTLVGVEAGRLLPQMDYSHDADGRSLTLVGNGATVDTYQNGESIFANLRFAAPSEPITFTVTPDEFCNWNEDAVTVRTWDVSYGG